MQRSLPKAPWGRQNLDDLDKAHKEWQTTSNVSNPPTIRELINHEFPHLSEAVRTAETIANYSDLKDIPLLMAEGAFDILLDVLQQMSTQAAAAHEQWKSRRDQFYQKTRASFVEERQVEASLIEVDGRPGGDVGTGFLIKYNEKCYVATAGHLVVKSKIVKLTYKTPDGLSEHDKVRVCGTSYPNHDLAVLEAPAAALPCLGIPVPEGEIIRLCSIYVDRGDRITLHPMSRFPGPGPLKPAPPRTGESQRQDDGRVMVALGNEERGWSGSPGFLTCELNNIGARGDVLAGIMSSRKIDRADPVPQSTGSWLEPSYRLLQLLRNTLG